MTNDETTALLPRDQRSIQAVSSKTGSSSNNDDDDTIVVVKGVDDDNSSSFQRQRRRQILLRVQLQNWIWCVFLISLMFCSLVFGTYMSSFYGRSILCYYDKIQTVWDIALPGMYHQEHHDTNVAMGIHFIAGAYLLLFGTLQYLPCIRRSCNFRFHRWNGRILIAAALCVSIGPLYYICVVGSMNTTTTIWKTANINNFLFGMLFLWLTFQTYYYARCAAAVGNASKNSDLCNNNNKHSNGDNNDERYDHSYYASLHKRWAYLLGGLNIANICLTIFFSQYGEVLLEHIPTMKYYSTIVNWFFFFPFLFGADHIWKCKQERWLQSQKREQEHKRRNHSSCVLKDVRNDHHPMIKIDGRKFNEDDDDLSSYTEDALSPTITLLKLIVSFCLVTIFVISVCMQSINDWIPKIMYDFSSLSSS